MMMMMVVVSGFRRFDLFLVVGMIRSLLSLTLRCLV